jgi:hypothetical protein
VSEEDEPPYEVIRSERGFEVVSKEGYSKVVCATEENAWEYQRLLVEAFRSGHRAGYRAAKRAARPDAR